MTIGTLAFLNYFDAVPNLTFAKLLVLIIAVSNFLPSLKFRVSKIDSGHGSTKRLTARHFNHVNTQDLKFALTVPSKGTSRMVAARLQQGLSIRRNGIKQHDLTLPLP